jgi:hypothetical protein
VRFSHHTESNKGASVFTFCYCFQLTFVFLVFNYFVTVLISSAGLVLGIGP